MFNPLSFARNILIVYKFTHFSKPVSSILYVQQSNATDLKFLNDSNDLISRLLTFLIEIFVTPFVDELAKYAG